MWANQTDEKQLNCDKAIATLTSLSVAQKEECERRERESREWPAPVLPTELFLEFEPKMRNLRCEIEEVCFRSSLFSFFSLFS
jgi:hypothetical protein